MDKQATDGPSQRQPSSEQRSDPADTAPRVLTGRGKADGASSRVAEFTLSDDGQLLEAGYGHGV